MSLPKKTTLQTRQLKKDEVSTEIDLKTLLGGAAKNRDVREAFFEIALEKMNSRLDSGRGVDGDLLSKYSKEYKESLAFKAFNKKNTVNMELTGDMRSSVKIIDQDSNKIKIGIEGDEAPKAYNHQKGDTLPQREWFGWTDKELKDIAKKFRPIKDEGPTISEEKILKLIDRVLGDG